MAMGMGFVIRMISEYHSRTTRRDSRPNHIESLPHLDTFRFEVDGESREAV